LAHTVWLIAGRELRTRLRARSFVIGTTVSIAVLVGLVLMQSSMVNNAGSSVVGLNGQAIAVADQLTRAAGQLGRQIQTREMTDLPAGEAMVASGELDALVSGAPAALQVLVNEELAADLRVALDGIVQQEVLRAQLAAVEDLDPHQLLDTAASAHANVRSLGTPDPQRGQRLAVALLAIALLYASLVLYGTMVAQGVVEEKSNRVVEILLSSVRPWQLLTGKVMGVGLVGLIQLAAIGMSGLLLAAATSTLTISDVAVGTLLWSLLWYVLGYFLYATVFAAAGALVSRQEDAQSAVMPITTVLVMAFLLGFGVLAQDASSTASTVLSIVPPLAPILMPAKIALGAATGWQIVLAIALTMTAVAVLTWLGARVYRNSVLHMGTRIKLRDALR
jgi:ABC-2 type transport system permease protein